MDYFYCFIWAIKLDSIIIMGTEAGLQSENVE